MKSANLKKNSAIALLVVMFFITPQLVRAQNAGPESETEQNTPENQHDKNLKTGSKEKAPETIWSLDTDNGTTTEGSGIELVRAAEGEFLQALESKEGVVIFRGGIIIRVQSGELHAETVKYNPGTGELYGEGGVELIDNLQVVRGEKFIYDVKNSMGVLYNVDGTIKPLYYFGNILKISSPENYSAQDAFYTTCEAKSPHYFLQAKKIWIQEDNQMVSYRVRYYVGQTPVFWLPLHFQTDLGTGIVTLVGQNSYTGTFLQNSYFFGFSPKKKQALFLPSDGMLMFDYYQKQGWYTGIHTATHNASLAYEIDLGLANYLYAQTITAGDGSSLRTNYVPLQDGSYGTRSEYWHEINANLKSTLRDNTQRDMQSALYVNVNDYGNRSFRRKFKERHIPETTPDTVWIDRRFPQTQQLDNSLLWEASYTEDWADNHFSIYGSRRKRWGAVIDGKKEQAYYPQLDIAPRITFEKNSYLAKPRGNHFHGVRNNLNLFTETTTEYKNGEQYRTHNLFTIYDEVNAYIPFTSWFTLIPGGGYGIKNVFSRNEDGPELQENRRHSYHYVYTLDTIQIGVPVVMAQASYENQYAVYRGEYEDPTFGNHLSHLTHLGILMDPAPFIHAQVQTARDLKTYPQPIEERFRWSPLSVETQIFLDFINGLSSYGLYDYGNHRLGLSLDNEYTYLIPFNRAAANSLGFSFEMGGYQLFFFQELWRLSTGLTWVHDFRNERLHQLRYHFDIDLNVAQNWRVISDVEAAAMAYQPGSTAYEPAYQTSLGFKTPFLLERASATLEHNLHNWTIRATYAFQKTWVTFGADNENQAGFYEHTFYFSLNLGSVRGVGIPDTEIYYFNPYDEGKI